MTDDKFKELSAKFKNKLKKELNYVDKAIISERKIKEDIITKVPSTKEYNEFKKEYMPKTFTAYEKLCNFSEKILKIKPGKKELPLFEEAIVTTHLNITPTGAASFSILGPFIVFFLGALIFGVIIPTIFSDGPLMFFIIFFMLVAVIMYAPIKQLPLFMANNWRLKASGQMVLCVFYVVTYMRHTSNLELAIEFASQHLAAPMSLDLRKVLWDVETEKYESARESLDIYLKRWKKTNLEFVEAFHLIEGSLLEGNEDRRLISLDKSLSVMLEETYEKMLHYSQNLQQPITMLNMLGVILPILGLVILPLVVSFVPDIKWYHIATMYNVFLPIIVYYLGKTILSSRPSGYGDTDVSKNPEVKKKRGLKFLGTTFKASQVGILFAIVFLFIGFSPLFIHQINPTWDFVSTGRGFAPVNKIGGDPPDLALMDYKCSEGRAECDVKDLIGPFGLGATLLGIAITLASGVGLGLYYSLRSSNIMKIRNDAKQLEKEFASALFQLGNRLGDGFPAEMAFGKVADNMEGTISGDFFAEVSGNISRLGMSVEQAIFDPHSGALTKYPSSLIESSMKVMTESVKKGPKIAAQALINISQYIKEMHRVNERLKDLMSENLASIKGQISFLTPTIAAIVIGITSMVTTILSKLTAQMAKLSGESGGGGQLSGIMKMFQTPNVPTYYFQIIVGLYVVQIIYILTILSNGIENGNDKLAERYALGKNLLRSTLMYAIFSFGVILVFNMIASNILQ